MKGVNIMLVFFVSFIFLCSLSYVSSIEDYDFVSFTRNTPDTYKAGIPFEITITIDINESVLVDGSLFFGETIQGGNFYEIGSDSSISSNEDVLFWKNLSLEDSVVSYWVVSDLSSMEFVGKWGWNSLEGDVVLCETCEGDILGDNSVSIMSSLVPGSGSGPSGGSSSSSSISNLNYLFQEILANDSGSDNPQYVDNFSAGVRLVDVGDNATGEKLWNWLYLLWIVLGVIVVILLIVFLLKIRKKHSKN